MKTLKAVLCMFFCLCCSVATYGIKQHVVPQEVIMENAEMRLILGGNQAVGLLHKPSGQECLEKAFHVPVFAITENRPYDNEQFLTYPAKRRTYPANRIERIGDKLKVGFRDNSYTATITLDITDYYIGFKLSQLECDVERFGVKRPTEIDEFTLLQLPVKKREHFGEWLNVAWHCPIALMGKLDQQKKHPRTEENLEVLRNWEEARTVNFLTEKQKEELKSSPQEYILLRNEKGEFELIPYTKVENVTGNSNAVQAFIFSRKCETWVVFWHASGKGGLQIPIHADHISLWEKLGIKKKILRKGKNDLLVPVDRCRFLVFDLPKEKVINVLEKSKFL